MNALMPIRELEAAAEKVGVGLTRIEGGDAVVDDGHLYVWVDKTSDENVLYIGKAASAQRLANESNWRKLGPNLSLSGRRKPMIASPIVSLLRRNARPEPRRYRVGFINWDLVDEAVTTAGRSLAESGGLDEGFIEEWPSAEPGHESRAASAVEEWLKADFAAWRDQYGADSRPKDSDIEAFLVRVVVRAGAVVGNAQYAGQWESLIYRAYDTLALLAVHETIPTETFELDDDQADES